jgi:hypothetical protein
MKKSTYINTVLITALVVVLISSCDNKREPGKIYMPDMAYSRAVETYAPLDSNLFTSDPAQAGGKIFYNQMPVKGTFERGQISEYSLPNDSAGYAMSAQIKNPLPPLNSTDSAEASRLFNINCAVCHGAEGKANGPIAEKIGAVANLTNDMYIKMADGTMYHSIQYGKNNMGSYASQLSRTQRWMIVQYIRTLQPKASAVAPAKADSSSVVKK